MAKDGGVYVEKGRMEAATKEQGSCSFAREKTKELRTPHNNADIASRNGNYDKQLFPIASLLY